MKLNRYDNSWYRSGSATKRALWFITSLCLFETGIPYPTVLKVAVLRLFGAKIGSRIVLKPMVWIKYPWNLHVESDVWIGKGVEIDNLEMVKIGNNVCISQNVCILTGNHNYRSDSFDLIVCPVFIGDAVWVGAYSKILPGASLSEGTVIQAGLVISHKTQANMVYHLDKKEMKFKSRYKND